MQKFKLNPFQILVLERIVDTNPGNPIFNLVHSLTNTWVDTMAQTETKPLAIEDNPHFELKPGSRHYTMKESSLPLYKLAVQHQLDQWVKGNSVHNRSFDECCPDFSCCVPQTKWHKDRRLAFANATPEERAAMLHMALREQISVVTNYDAQLSPKPN